MKTIFLIVIIISVHSIIFPQNGLQTLWNILEKEDTSSLSRFFNEWSKGSIPIAKNELTNLTPLIKNTYDIVECFYTPFQLPNDDEELDSIELAIPYVVFPTKFTVRIMDSLFFESKHLQQNWRDLIIEEQNNFDFKPQLFSNNKKILLLDDITDLIVDTTIEREKQEYFDQKISLLSKYIILQEGYRYGLSKYRIRIATHPYPSIIDFNEAFDFAIVFFSTSRYSAMKIPFIKKDNCWVIDESKPKEYIMY